MLDVMLDLETMSTDPNAAIIAIGAVEFDIATQEIGERFYAVIDLASSVKSGGLIDASTVLWWMKRSDEARAEFANGGESIEVTLRNFSAWIGARGRREDVRVWGNGAAFDNVVLATAYRRSEIQQPWLVWNDRCYRTVKGLNRAVKMQRMGTHHNAVDDAESQARHLLALMAPSSVGREN
jgi:hypothetical protein